MEDPVVIEEMKTYRGRDEVPADFDDFWNQAIAGLELPVAYRLVEKDFGLADDVCYPITQFAMYNRLECEKEYHLMPEYGHEGMFVYASDKVFNWLCGTQFDSKSLFTEFK